MKCFYSRDPYTLIRVYKTYVRPLLKYSLLVRSFYRIGLGDIRAIKSVRRSFTCKVLHVCHKPYISMLTGLNK